MPETNLIPTPPASDTTCDTSVTTTNTTTNLLNGNSQALLEPVNWSALLTRATAARDGIQCILLPEVRTGGSYIVRGVQFADGVKWAARVRIPTGRVQSGDDDDDDETRTQTQNKNEDGDRDDESETVNEEDQEHREERLATFRSMVSEYITTQLIRSETTIPTPTINVLELDPECEVKAPFMLTDWLDGRALNSLDFGFGERGDDGGEDETKEKVLRQIANVHLQLFTTRLPQIGTITGINEDGTYAQGPIPGIGGPFSTASRFYSAWAENIKSEITLRSDSQTELAGSPLLARIEEQATKSLSDTETGTGPFPLWHAKFGPNKMDYDEVWDLLGVIDWEHAFAAPVEIAGLFPLGFTGPFTTDGVNNAEMVRTVREQRTVEREDYISAVREEEEKEGWFGCGLSAVLDYMKGENLASALRIYVRGRAGVVRAVNEGSNGDDV